MAMPAISQAFGDLLDPRFQDVARNELEQLDDMIPTLFGDAGSNGRNNMSWSQLGTFDDWVAFTGQVSYDTMYQGYDVTLTPLEFVSGFQVERKLYDDTQFGAMDERPQGLMQAYQRTRQKHAARPLTNAFSVDTMFYSHSEGVALCSDSHTTNSGASTASGFDNKATAAFSATAVAAARIQFVNFRGDRAERFGSKPDELWYPPNLYEIASEIINSSGKVDTALNNQNVHQNAYTGHEWLYLSDSNDWFMCDSRMRKRMLLWLDRTALEFAFVEDFDTMAAKWRGYGRWGFVYRDWRWILGSQVS